MNSSPHLVSGQGVFAGALRSQQVSLLVVDDQPVNIQALYQVFSQDHQVLMATTGERALALCRQNPPDIVLLDLVMPGTWPSEASSRRAIRLIFSLR